MLGDEAGDRDGGIGKIEVTGFPIKEPARQGLEFGLNWALKWLEVPLIRKIRTSSPS